MDISNLLGSDDNNENDEKDIDELIPKNLITLISKEGEKFYIPKKHAQYSGYIKNILEIDFPCQEKDSTVINLPNINSKVLDVIIHYWAARDEYEPFLGKPFSFNFDPHLLPEVTLASSFLQT